MNAVVDAGNTHIKVGLFENQQLQSVHRFTEWASVFSFLQAYDIEGALLSSVQKITDADTQAWKKIGKKNFILHAQLPLPITLQYQTPNTLGADRIAAACGAVSLFPNTPCLVMDVGTCLTFEYVDEKKVYHGGAISPGIRLRFQAMHDYTANLPALTHLEKVNSIENSTATAMQSGVYYGLLGEMLFRMQAFLEKYPNGKMIGCGGDIVLFKNDSSLPIVIEENIVLIGLHAILDYQ